ncbi:MAG: DUF4331 family protein [bacterium]
MKQATIRMNMKHAALATLALVSLAGCGGGGNGDGDDGFAFSTASASQYVQIDSHAMPEAGTALIEAANGLGGTALRDSYNSMSPTQRGSSFNAEIGASLELFHTALDDDLTGLGLSPATPQQALSQGAPLVVPEVMRYNPAQPASFPNGRALSDRVVDITLAVVLLDLTAQGQGVTTFADLPLNPAGNDKAFLPAFPYLAAPHDS